MNEVIFQIESKRIIETGEIAAILVSLIDSKIDIAHSIDSDSVLQSFILVNTFILPNKKAIIKYKLTLDLLNDFIDTAELESLISDFLCESQKIDDIDKILKYEDPFYLSKGIDYHKDIYIIEMHLREVVNYILLYNDKENFRETFKDFSVNCSVLNAHPEQAIREQFENELYYISFSEYTKFNDPKILSDKEVIAALQNATTFERFKEEIEGRKLSNRAHIDFLSEIRPLLEPIEKIRNATMHNRAIKVRYVNDYIMSKEELQKAIRKFWQNEKEGQLPIIINWWLEEAESNIEEFFENITWKKKQIDLPQSLNDKLEVAISEINDIGALTELLEIIIDDSKEILGDELSSLIPEEEAKDSARNLINKILYKYEGKLNEYEFSIN